MKPVGSIVFFLHQTAQQNCLCSASTYRPNVKLGHSDHRIVDDFQAVITLSMLEVRLFLFFTIAGLLYKVISVIRRVNFSNISLKHLAVLRVSIKDSQLQTIEIVCE